MYTSVCTHNQNFVKYLVVKKWTKINIPFAINRVPMWFNDVKYYGPLNRVPITITNETRFTLGARYQYIHQAVSMYWAS